MVRIILLAWPFVAWSVFIALLFAYIRMQKIYNILAYDNEKQPYEQYRSQKNKLRRRVVVLRILMVWFLIIGIIQLDPLQRYPGIIEANILRSTPVGMMRNDVEHIVHSVNGRRLASPLSNPNIIANITQDDTASTAGRTVRTHLGSISHFLIFRSDVVAIWVFDTDGSLLGVNAGRLLRI